MLPCSLFLLKLHFFSTTVRRRCLGAVVLQMPDGNDGDAERKTQSMFIVSSKTIIFISKASIFISKLHECASVSLSMCFFFIFFIACSLFLLKLPFLSQKALIFISKLHECASVSLSMCFFSIFFTTCSLFLLKLPFLSQKTLTFISKLHECASFSLSILNVLKLRTLVFFAFVSNLCQCNHFWFFSKATLTMSLYIPWNIYIRVT
ncbi:hypothetical protein HKD37_19G052872 [Glycine soja]